MEPNVGYSEFARDQYQTRVSTAHLSSLAPDSVDIVTMFHVLEHLPDPKSAIERMFNALRSGGYLFIEVPNILQSDASPHNIYFQAHLFYFSLNSLLSLTSPFFELITHEDRGNLRVLLKKRLSIADTVYPSADRVRADLHQFEKKGWLNYLIVGRGYSKLLNRARRIIEESAVKSYRPREILDSIYSDSQGGQTALREKIFKRWRWTKRGFTVAVSVGILGIAYF